MRSILALIVFLIPLAARARNVQHRECIGDPHKKVRAVYLHGMFPRTAAGPHPDYLGLESNNRAVLDKVARDLGIRIAVPIAPFAKEQAGPDFDNRFWTTHKEQFRSGPKKGENKISTAEQVHDKACQACGGECPVQPTALVGFSNGGNMARVLCSEGAPEYAKVIAIGYNNDKRGPPDYVSSAKCGSRIAQYKAHEMLSAAQLEKELASVAKQKTFTKDQIYDDDSDDDESPPTPRRAAKPAVHHRAPPARQAPPPENGSDGFLEN